MSESSTNNNFQFEDLQKTLAEKFEKRQLQDNFDSTISHNALVERCFDECILTFRARKLDDKEELCVLRCADKYVQVTQRVRADYERDQAQTMFSRVIETQLNESGVSATRD